MGTRGGCYRMMPELSYRHQFDDAGMALAGDVPDNIADADKAIAAYVRGYLQEDILVKVDRASMAVSLEVRSPFLDPNVVKFLGNVTASLKLRGLTGKYLLRRLMRGRIPDAIIDRRKHGFGVPINTWLRQSLAPLLQEYLGEDRLRASGLLDAKVVTRLVAEHTSGLQDRGQLLWPLLLFELWRERWLKAA
jgi:asparagine synthase (glutamine-hydrolysing)